MTSGLGGENLTPNIKHEGQEQFKSAGYEEIKTNGTYVGGMVRQAGPLSFSRVFEAGHEGNPTSSFNFHCRMDTDRFI